MIHPVDVPTNETLQFILDNISAGVSRMLEVGCGRGELAARLAALGHDVTAIDASAEAVEAAKRNGVNAVEAEWPRFEAEPFDVVLFTRSLHHIHELDAALDQAKKLLKPSGRLIVEDFAFNETDEFTAEWFYRLLAVVNACGALRLEDDTFVKALIDGGGAVDAWHHDHGHELHSAGAMLAAIRERFPSPRAARCPYLYRYVSQAVADDARGAEIVLKVLELEKTLGREREASLIGRRFVVRMNPES